jgi:hypothetical protein
MDDVVIPIVYTEYKIAVPNTRFDLPKWLNDAGVPDFETPKKLENLGHAAALFIQGKTGLTKYYEYGRYDPAAKGLTRRQSLPDMGVTKSGEPVWATLRRVLKAASSKGGQGGKITAAWIVVPGKFQDMLDYCERRMKENTDAKRESYDLLFNSCNHFMKGVIEAGGARTPVMVDKRPVSYIHEIRDLHPDLDYDPRGDTLAIEGVKTT